MLHLRAPFLVAALLLACPALAEEFIPFYLDPAESHLRFISGEVSFALSSEDFVSAPLALQPGAPEQVPLSGTWVMRALPTLEGATRLLTLSGAADTRTLDVGAATPADGALPGTAPAALGVSFFDPTYGVGGDLVLRDLVFGMVGDFFSTPDGEGGLDLLGSLDWYLAGGTLDADGLLTGSAPIAGYLLKGGIIRGQSSVERLSPDLYRMSLPFLLNASFSVPGPLSDASAFLQFDGQVVAYTQPVPEPSTGLLLGAALLIAVVARRGAAR